MHKIPKIIHYCWFGGSVLPDMAIKCIESWKKYCPDYEIKEWNESNFDLHLCIYAEEAYRAKKWAFVSDYVRFKILYKYGGIYFDTDVELIKPINDIIEKGSFMGCEQLNNMNIRRVAPGLGIAAIPGLDIYKKMINFYEHKHFFDEKGRIEENTVVNYTTNLLKKYGFNQYENRIQKVANIYIYPDDYFCPMNYETGEIIYTNNTRSIHHYSATWHSKAEKFLFIIQRKMKSKNKIIIMFQRLITLPIRIYVKIEKTGIKNTLLFILKKVLDIKKKEQKL